MQRISGTSALLNSDRVKSMKRHFGTALLAAVCLISAGCSDAAPYDGTAESAEASPAVTEVTDSSSAATSATTVSTSASEETTTAVTTTTAATTTTATSVTDEPVIVEPDTGRIELSGDPEDIFIAEEDLYVEGESVVLYFQKGVTVRGDMLKVTERIMDSLSAATGMSFDKGDNAEPYTECKHLYFDKYSFTDINADADKIDILILDLGDDYVQWAASNTAVLDHSDYDYDSTYNQTIYHELAHVLQYRNGMSLSRTLDEGFATYIADKAMRADGVPAWVSIQYYAPYEYDDSAVFQGEEGFVSMHAEGDANYQYGIRLMTFLHEEYGQDIYMQILEKAHRQGFSDSFSGADLSEASKAHTEQLKTILRSATGDANVLERFAEWYSSSWNDQVESYMLYMESLGLEVR